LIPHAEDDPEGQLRVRALRTQLRKRGWIEGTNLHITYRWSVSSAERVRTVAAEFVATAPDAIMVFGTLGLAVMQKATQKLPIIFAQVSDPVGRGFVASAARPAGNITGFSDYEAGFAVKWVELLKEIAPAVKRAAVIYDGRNPGAMFFPHMQAGAPKLGVQAFGMVLQSPADVERSVGSLANDGATGVVVLAGSTTLRLRSNIITELERARIPAIYPYRAFAQSGGLVSYGADIPAIYVGAGSYVDLILRGAKPADLPVQFASRFDLVINMRTAKTIGLVVPVSIVLRADEVIE
jgi:putative ABC transport system substrate-binding protein